MGWGQGAQCGWLLVVAAVLSACSSMSPAAPEPATAKHILQKNFTVGELKAAAVGETMVSLKDYYEKERHNVWSVGQAATLRVGLGSMVLIPGDYTAVRHVQEDGSAYDAVEIKVHPFELTTLKPSSASVPMMFFIDDSGRVARAGGGLGITTEVSDLDPADFRATRGEKTSIDARHGYTNFELLYAGVDAGAVRITYREYAPNDPSRPAKFQDLTYNLTDKSIRFKDVAIDVESADNQNIRFRVKSVPQDWMSAGAP
ncbi:MAG TPA: hypothetical protein VHU18_04300 [Rhizomicrobium sp.]|jgi:hypothetical protein|nr:hypothetical protein [Rhizomicrobium sp.]